jgi:ATP-binding cassette subfamily B protein
MLLFAPAAAALFIACVFFLFINYIFACILLGWAVLHFAICLLGFKKCHDLSFQHSAKRNVLTEKIVDTFSNIMCVKLFARQKYEYDYIHSFQAEEKQSQTALLEGVERVKILLGALTFLAPGVLMMYFTIHSWKMNLISVGDVVLIMGATWNVLQLAWITGLEMPNLFRDIGICSQAMTVIEEECSKEETIGQTKENFVKGRIDIDSVRFGYHLNKKIFDDFSVSIEPGSKVALVGMTGSGKSTLVNLLVRLFDCQSGNILIDGVDIAKMPLSSLREQIAVVPQNPVLFCRSVRDNIAYGNQLASEENIIRAAKKAYCHDFIEQLEYGYDTNVGASGVKLSNGQCQQIAIARAFLKDAPILILDEATSALDVLTEAKIQSSIRDLMIGRTTLVIAHRLSTLKNMDTIIVLQEGRIIENATHDALLKKKGHYSAMWHKLGDDINA